MLSSVNYDADGSLQLHVESTAFSCLHHRIRRVLVLLSHRGCSGECYNGVSKAVYRQSIALE